MAAKQSLINPFRAGAGHLPPYVAGRDGEIKEFAALLKQHTITKNLIVSGTRGVGKTVLLETYKPIAHQAGWVWLGSDFSEAAFVTEEALCKRLLADLSMFTNSIKYKGTERSSIGFHGSKIQPDTFLDYPTLINFFSKQPGLTIDKIKLTFEALWPYVASTKKAGLIFAYDEAQIMDDKKENGQFPLAVLIELFQFLQRKDFRCILLLCGLPILFQKLTNARTYTERMFTVQDISVLSPQAAKDAIEKPLQNNIIKFSNANVTEIISASGGYPFLLQYICYEFYESILQSPATKKQFNLPLNSILAKLDTDFYSTRLNKITDRQRDLLYAISKVNSHDSEFTISEILESQGKSNTKFKHLSRADIAQMMPKLVETGLIYRNRRGKYSFAIPLFGLFIRRSLS